MNPKTILIVDDEAAERQIMTETLVDEKFNVLTAADGNEGLQVALEKHPDLILLDLIMPNKDGLALLAELRNDPWGEHVPVIVLTNRNDMEASIQSWSARVAGYYVKAETTLADLTALVKEKLNQPSV